MTGAPCSVRVEALALAAFDGQAPARSVGPGGSGAAAAELRRPGSATKCGPPSAGKALLSRGAFRKVLAQAQPKAQALNSWRRIAGLWEELNRILNAANNPPLLNCIKQILGGHKELNSSTSPSFGTAGWATLWASPLFLGSPG